MPLETGVRAVLQGKPNTPATGAINVLPDGSVITDGQVTLPTGSYSLGYVSSEGVTMSVDGELSKIMAWGTDVVKTLRPEHSIGFNFGLIEAANPQARQFIHGVGNVEEDASGNAMTVKWTSQTLPISPLTIDMLDGDVKKRLFIPLGQPNFSSEISYNDSDVEIYQMTVEALPDADGVKVYEYTYVL